MRPLKAAERQLIAAALAMPVLLLVYWLTVHLWFIAPLRELTEEISNLRESHWQALRLLERGRDEHTHLLDPSENAQRATLLLSGSDNGAAVAQVLQQVATDVQTVATASAPCSLTNRLPQTPIEAGDFVKIQVDVSLKCTLETLGRLLYRMEHDTPALFIELLQIQRGLSNADLTVQLSVSAYLHNANAAQAQP